MLQLFCSLGGLDLPNIRKHQLACQLRFIADSEKIQNQFDFILRAHNHRALQNYFFVKSPKDVKALCDNTIVLNTWKAWTIIHRIEWRARTTIYNNPEFKASLSDPGFKIWRAFKQTKWSVHFSKSGFLQIRDYTFKTNLNINRSMSPIEEILLKPLMHKQMHFLVV